MLLLWKNNKYCTFWVSICSLSYSASKAHGLHYCHLWSIRLYENCLHYQTHGTIFGEMLLNIKCISWFSLQILSEKFIILRRNQRDTVINVKKYSCKVPVIRIILWWRFNFIHSFSKNNQISNLMKILPAGAEFFHADEWRDKVEKAESRWILYTN